MKLLRLNRLAVPAALAVTAVVLAAAASAGGLRDASSAAQRAVHTIKRAVETGPPPKKVSAASAGRDQYQPGFGFGDPAQNHEGPPGLARPDKQSAAPKTSRTSTTVSLATTVTLSEQAVLTLSVVDGGGTAMTIAQNSSSIGGTALSGGPTRSIVYTVLVPRVLEISLAILIGPDYAGGRYTIRVSAVDPDGNKSTSSEAFKVPEKLKVSGSAGPDRVTASSASDVIETGAGNDVINTGSGNDVVSSGAGADTIVAPKGNTRIDAGSGDDRVTAGSGANRIVGGPGRDVIKAGGGNDTINSRDRERDLVNGGSGRDTCIADAIDVLISCELVRIR